MHFYVRELSQSREDCGYRKCTQQWLYRQGLITLFMATDFKNCYCCIIIYRTLYRMLVPSSSSGVTNVSYILCSKELVVDPYGDNTILQPQALATAAGEGNCVGIHPTHDYTKVRAMASASSNIHRDPSPSWCPLHSLPPHTDHNHQHILQCWQVVMYVCW